MKNIILYTLSIILISAKSAFALVSIDINRGNVDPVNIAMPYMTGSADLGRKITEVVQDDLENCGLFRSINRQAFLEKVSGVEHNPNFANWRQISAALLFAGEVKQNGNQFEAKFKLWDVLSQEQAVAKSYSTNVENWRRIAHLIADEIYKRITGEDGYFDTRIVYVSETGTARKRKKRLAIMDQDGANHRFLTGPEDLVLTPRFSPTAQEVIYLSYKSGKARVYVLDVDTGSQKLVGDFKGMSFSPRFSPDGRAVIMSVAQNGNTEIYKMDIASGRRVRLTNNKAIDTSPSYSPDGKKIVFNSDRGGAQQLYLMNSDGSGVKRISFSGGRYGTPVWSPRGDQIAFTKIKGGKFSIGVMNVDGTGERLLTSSYLDEAPTWAPNGRVLMFGRQTRHRRGKPGSWSINSIDMTGYHERKIPTPYGASDPAWSPLP